jgi:hypothetical protein
VKRQIGGLYYERSGLSKYKKKRAALAQEGTETAGKRIIDFPHQLNNYYINI